MARTAAGVSANVIKDLVNFFLIEGTGTVKDFIYVPDILTPTEQKQNYLLGCNVLMCNGADYIEFIPPRKSFFLTEVKFPSWFFFSFL